MQIKIPQSLERGNQEGKVVQGRIKLIGRTPRFTRQSLGINLQAHIRKVP
jgi:hypothetical protein